MHLKEYLEQEHISQTKFAKDLGVNLRTIANVFAGFSPSLEVAVQIEKFTKGKVKCRDLISKKRRTKKPLSKKENS